MALGIALLLIFVLYLIDKHNQWRRAAKIGLGVLVFAVLASAGLYLWSRHVDKVEREETELAQKQAEEQYNKEKQEDPYAAIAKPVTGVTITPDVDRHVVKGPDGKYYSFPKGRNQTSIDAYFAKRFPHVKVLRDSDLTTDEFGGLKSGHLKKDEIATLLVDDGGWVKVKTEAGGVGWSRSDGFEVITEAK
jgi:hypothetical protein